MQKVLPCVQHEYRDTDPCDGEQVPVHGLGGPVLQIRHSRRSSHAHGINTQQREHPHHPPLQQHNPPVHRLNLSDLVPRHVDALEQRRCPANDGLDYLLEYNIAYHLAPRDVVALEQLLWRV